MHDEQIKNLSYALFRIMGGWVSRQCYENEPSQTRQQVLADIETNLRHFAETITQRKAE